ncbi:hypothetical protein Tco_1039816 [Tanacetum coccineum]
MKVIPDDEEIEVHAILLATKPPSIVDFNILKEGKIIYFQIIRADGSSKRPEEDYERVLWGDLKTMFEPHVEDLVSKSACLYVGREKYPLTPATITKMLNKKLQADHWNEMIKRLLDDLRVTAAKLMLLVQKLLLLVLKVNAAERLQLLEEFMLTEKRSKTYQRKDKDCLKIKITYVIIMSYLWNRSW